MDKKKTLQQRSISANARAKRPNSLDLARYEQEKMLIIQSQRMTRITEEISDIILILLEGIATDEGMSTLDLLTAIENKKSEDVHLHAAFIVFISAYLKGKKNNKLQKLVQQSLQQVTKTHEINETMGNA